MVKQINHIGPISTWGDAATQLIQLDQTCLAHEAWDRPDWERFTTAGVQVNIACLNKKWVGYLAWQDLGHNEIELLKLGVDANHRRCGIASFLLTRLSLKLGTGAHTYLELRASNQGAQRLYVKSEYQFVRRRKNYYKNPIEDALLYEKQT